MSSVLEGQNGYSGVIEVLDLPVLDPSITERVLGLDEMVAEDTAELHVVQSRSR